MSVKIDKYTEECVKTIENLGLSLQQYCTFFFAHVITADNFSIQLTYHML